MTPDPDDRDSALQAQAAADGPEGAVLVRQAMTAIPGVIACGLVDLGTGGWIELETHGGHPEDFLEYLAVHTTTLFEGDAVRTVKQVLVTSPRAQQPTDIDQIIMRTGRLTHYFRRLAEQPQVVFSLVVRRNTKLGLVLRAIDQMLGDDGAPAGDADAGAGTVVDSARGAAISSGVAALRRDMR